MEAQGTLTGAVATRLLTAIGTFARSEVGWRAKLMFATIVALLFAANGLNVANSFVNRNLMSAIAERHIPAFVRQAEFTVAVFAGSTIVAVLARFAEERLGLLWRELLTERAVAVYMANGTYYRLATSGELANPDQRIAETHARSPPRRSPSFSWRRIAPSPSCPFPAYSGRSALCSLSSPLSMPRSARI